MKKINLLLILILVLGKTQTQSRFDLERERLKIIDKIEFTNGIIKKNLKDKENTLLYFNAVKSQINNRQQILSNLKIQLEELNNKAYGNQKLIDSLNEKKKTFSKQQSKLLRSAYINQISKNKFIFLLSSDGIDEYLDRKRYLKQSNQYVIAKIKSLEYERMKILNSISETNNSKQTINNLIVLENENIKKLNEESELKEKLLRDIGKNEIKFRVILTYQNIKREQLNKNIENVIISGLRGNTSINKKTEGSTKIDNFALSKSKLQWPVSEGYISSSFGKHAHPGLKGVYINNSGVDIVSNPSENVKAVFDGEVVGLMHISGYNWMIILKHDEYYSVYSKLENVNISKGDKVVKNQILGRLAENGEFHFEIWHLKTKLNPEQWLNRSIY
jgi:murein hydrolase activator